MSKFKKLRKTIGKTSVGSVPTDPALYSRVKSEAKKKFDRVPSAYSSAWIVKTYKARGGGYK
jgi:hypothetical protein